MQTLYRKKTTTQAQANPKKRKLAVAQYIPVRAKAFAPEKKLFDVGVGDYAVNTTGNFTLLNGLVRGTGLYGERVGAKVNMTKISISGQIASNTAFGAVSQAAAPQTARLIVVQDKQCNGAIFSLTDLLDTATANALYQGDWLGRYKILYDRRWDLEYVATAAGPTYGSSGGGKSMHSFHIEIPCYATVHYNNGNTGGVADIDSNSIYMLWVGTVAASATLAATARVGVQAHYTDV